MHINDDKRDHFESLKDVWELFRVVLDERKKREIDPTMRMLAECIAEAAQQRQGDGRIHGAKACASCTAFFETTTAWYAQVRKWPTAAIVKFVKLGDKVLKVLGLGG